jgi:hypothetical protein
MFASHDGAAQVNGGDAIECGLGYLVERRVPAGDTYADIVVKDVDSAPTPFGGFDHRRECCLFGNIRFKRRAFSTELSSHSDRFLGGAKIIVDCHYLGASLNEPKDCGAAIPHSLAGRLTSTYDDGDLVPQTHVSLGWKMLDAQQKLRTRL